MDLYIAALKGVIEQSGFIALSSGNLTMLLVSFILLYLAIAKDFEPLLLLPIAFGCLLVNLPLSGIVDEGGFLYFVKFSIFRKPIFLFYLHQQQALEDSRKKFHQNRRWQTRPSRQLKPRSHDFRCWRSQTLRAGPVADCLVAGGRASMC